MYRYINMLKKISIAKYRFVILLLIVLNVFGFSKLTYAYTYEKDTLLTKTYLVKYINNYRKMYSLTPVLVSEELSEASQNHALYVKYNNSTGSVEDADKAKFTGMYPWDRARSLGFNTSLITEEIVKTKQNPKDIIDSLMLDPSIRLNLLNPNNKYVGIGIVNEIYVIDFAQGNNLNEGEIAFPLNQILVRENTNLLNADTSSVISLMYFAKEEILEISNVSASLKRLDNSTSLEIDYSANLVSNSKAMLIITPHQKLVQGLSYQVDAEYTVHFVSGDAKVVRKSWRFTGVNSVKLMVLQGTNAQKSISTIRNHWAYEKINKFYNNDYVELDLDGSYAADSPITRGELADMIAKALELWNVSDSLTFKDVSPDDKYYESIRKVCSCNIMQGASKNQFSPSVNLTREEMIVIMANVYEQLKGNVSLSNFKSNLKDLKECSSWSQDKVKKMINVGLIKGKDNYTISPKDKLTKAECIVLIDRLKDSVDLY